MGDYDIPANLEYICKLTGQEKVTYVGHSMGTTQMFYAMATNAEYFKKRLNLFVALAPAIILHNSQLAYLVNTLSKIETFLESNLANLGVREIFGLGWEL
jgi:pimeloyl-ACP methyl ester carboxylesterase